MTPDQTKCEIGDLSKEQLAEIEARDVNGVVFTPGGGVYWREPDGAAQATHDRRALLSHITNITARLEHLLMWRRRALEAEANSNRLAEALAKEVNSPTFMGEPILSAVSERVSDERLAELISDYDRFNLTSDGTEFGRDTLSALRAYQRLRHGSGELVEALRDADAVLEEWIELLKSNGLRHSAIDGEAVRAKIAVLANHVRLSPEDGAGTHTISRN